MGQLKMTEEEVEVLAQELAKVGGTAWYPGRQASPLLRVVTNRYREQARVIIAAYDELRSRERDTASDVGELMHPSTYSDQSRSRVGATLERSTP